jgi:hypothetical protein
VNASRIESPGIPHDRSSDNNQRKTAVAGRHFEDSQQASQASDTRPGGNAGGVNVQAQPTNAASGQDERPLESELGPRS